MTDSQIIALFWERNEDAIQETDAVYGRKLYAISDKILHSQQDVEESVSDTYMRAWETIPPQKPNYTGGIRRFPLTTKCSQSMYNL